MFRLKPNDNARSRVTAVLVSRLKTPGRPESNSSLAQWLSSANPNDQRGECSSPKVAGSCNSSLAAKLAPTTKLQADHAALGGIALSFVFGPRVG